MPKKILIIDDSTTVQNIIRDCLKDEGLLLISSLNGPEGLALAHAERPDVILLDIEMPPPDGFEICRQLKSSDQTRHIPIIFLTGCNSTDEKVVGLDLGATDYVTKPFAAGELRARVRATLRSKYLADMLAQKAMVDALTGVWNRAYFDCRLEQEVSLHNRTGSPLSLVMADIDRFKSFNDTYGHSFGDQVLAKVAAMLGSCARKEDALCRYGGEEFCILVPRINAQGAAALAERARLGVETLKLQHRESSISVTCSFGVAESNGGSGSDLIEAADQALYQAKLNGRNRVVCASVEQRSSPLQAAGR